MDNAAEKGVAAMTAGNFLLAVEHYTNAITRNPKAVDYYIKRSTAYTRLSPSNPALALKDAETALVLAKQRAKLELIAQSQLRRGIALYALEKFGDARKCFEWVKKLTPKEKSLSIWELKTTNKISTLEEGDQRTEANIVEIPDIDVKALGVAPEKTEKTEKTMHSNNATSTSSAGSQLNTTSIAPKPQLVQTPASQIRHDWYQSHDTVTVTLMAKGVPKDRSNVDIKAESISISFPLATGSDYDFSIDPLYASIDPNNSSFMIMATKVEFVLRKSIPGQKWHDLEATGQLSSEGKASISTDAPVQSAAHVYPTSSKTGPKNWDKVLHKYTKGAADHRGKGSEPPSDLDPDDLIDFDAVDGDETKQFFSTLFAGADPDSKRAMMKSYTESQGTALSTNWGEVSKGPVAVTPPDSMEQKFY